MKTKLHLTLLSCDICDRTLAVMHGDTNCIPRDWTEKPSVRKENAFVHLCPKCAGTEIDNTETSV